jgi:hypothetical protein
VLEVLERFRIEVMPWDAVPVPGIVYVGFLPWTDDRIDATFSIELTPRFSTMYPTSEKTVAEDFYRTLLRRRLADRPRERRGPAAGQP